MPANLTPQYHEAEKRFRQARTIPEKIAALQEMMAVIPKHKGTDHLRADLRARMAKLLDDLNRPTGPAGGRSHPFSIRKEGAGQAAIIGLPNVGKSQLLATLTGASVKVGHYPFTTQEPTPGMLRYQNVRIQVIDTPPIADQGISGPMYGLMRNADLFIIVVDLTADPVSQLQAVTSELERWGFRLLGRDEEPDPEEKPTQKRAVIVGSKADADGALDAFQALAAECGERFPVVMVSALEEVGLEELGREIFTALGIMRVYTKAPGRDPSYDEPMVLPRGSTVLEAAESIHKDWLKRLKYAVLWGSGKFEGQRVGRDYVLADGDVIELH